MAEVSPNLVNRVKFLHQYSAISRQMGHLDALYERIVDEPNIDNAIKMARSMRGHVAVILKALHSIKRGDKAFAEFKKEGTNNVD